MDFLYLSPKMQLPQLQVPDALPPGGVRGKAPILSSP